MSTKKKTTKKATTPKTTAKTTTKASAAKTATTAKAVKKSASKTTVKAVPTTKKTYSSEEVAERAYFIWQQRGQDHGQDVDDWLQAEKELSVVAS